MKLLFAFVSVLGFTLSLMSSDARANIVYDFSGVKLSDGGNLTGSFTTNDARNTLLGFDVTTSPQIGIGHHYTAPADDSISTSLPFILVLHAPAGTIDNILQVTFNNLTAAGAPITIGTFDSFEQHGTARRDIISGSVIAVPEPSTAALLALGGLGLVGYLARRRG